MSKRTIHSQASSRRVWGTLVLAAVLPFSLLVLLYRLALPLGMPGRFVYLYSPVTGWRLCSIPAALLLAGAIGFGTWLLSASRINHQRVGFTLVAIGLIGLAFWSYLAPPDHLEQHIFNMESPSQDGAFAREAARIGNVKAYLQAFPQRAQTPPQQMRGTRVISNPPGTTLLAQGLLQMLGSWSPLHDDIRRLVEQDEAKFDETAELSEAALVAFCQRAALGIVLCWALVVLWLLSAVPLYALGRLFFLPPAAMVFAVCCLVSPMTLLFLPGKDAAQLLTVALPLWLWFVAVRRDWWWAALLSGALFVPAVMVSLVHVWLAAIVVVACLLDARHSRGQPARLLARALLPAGIGAAVIAGGLYILADWNILATAWAVAQSQAEVTRGPEGMPLSWQLLGIPLFLLFAGPALWSATMWQGGGLNHSRDQDSRLGLYLLICTLAVMLITIGCTNAETPRLWIPFVPLLLLGVLLRLEAFHQPASHQRALLSGLIFVQIVFSALHWVLMDMREAESRLLSGDLFW